MNKRGLTIRTAIISAVLGAICILLFYNVASASFNMLTGGATAQYERLVERIDDKIKGQDVDKVLLDVPKGKMIAACKGVDTLCYCGDIQCSAKSIYGRHSFNQVNGYGQDYMITINGQQAGVIDGNDRKKPDFVIIELNGNEIKLTDCYKNPTYSSGTIKCSS